MATSTATLSISSHTTNTHGRRACLAKSNTHGGRYLFIVGGCIGSPCPDTSLNSFQIYDIAGDTLSDGPGITTKRSFHACSVNNNGHLYVFGGIGTDGSHLDSIERIDVSNPASISLQQWEFVDSLNQPTLDLRTIEMNDDIYILGGRGVNTVDVIYGTDPGIVYPVNNLPIGIRAGCAVTVNQQIYLLGGGNSGNYLNSIYWAKLVSPSPTPSPTPAPTPSPTRIPTPLPTTSPTLIPTPLPTALCPDYTTAMISNDGQDAIYDSFSEFSQRFQWNMTDNDTVLYSAIMNNTLLYKQIESSKAPVKCNNNSDICYIPCVKTDSCSKSYINASALSLSRLRILCYEPESCRSLTINIIHSSIAVFEITCNQSLSCDQLKIFTSQANDNNITLICNGRRACMDVVVEANIDTEVSGFLSVHCNEARSCDHLTINVAGNDKDTNDYNYHVEIFCHNEDACEYSTVDVEGNIPTAVNMYKFSNNISIIHQHTDVLQTVCNYDNDERYIQLPTANKLVGYTELLELAKSEYQNNLFPCQSVTIYNNEETELCKIKNVVNTNKYNLSKIIEKIHNDAVSCLWIEMNDVVMQVCHPQPNPLFIYNKSIETDLRFDESCNISTICNDLFGSIEATKNTLSNINVIFEKVLYTYTCNQSIDCEITNPLNTVLTDNSLFLDCSVLDFGYDDFFIPITTTIINIQSGISNRKNFDELFMNHFKFMYPLKELLSEYFECSITMTPPTVLIYHEKFPIWKIILLILAAVLLVLLIIYFINKYKWSKAAMFIKNPLVVAVVIGIYDVSNDLEGIENDAEHMKELFQNRMKYTVHTGQMTTYWTKQELLDFLTLQAKQLSDNVISPENLNGYDGLMVVISSHGGNGDNIISSDEEEIHHTKIHRIFSASTENAKCRIVPRVFIFDCCRGNHQANDDRNMSVISRTTAASSVAPIVAIMRYRQRSNNEEMVWGKNQHNPDFKLVIIKATNTDFQSKMRIDTGSYFIKYFVNAIERNDEIGGVFSCRNKSYLSRIVTNIQNHLEQQKIQLPEPCYNNGTSKIIFVKNDHNKYSEGSCTEMVEMNQEENLEEKLEIENLPVGDIKKGKSEVETSSESDKEGNNYNLVLPKGIKKKGEK